MDNPGAIITGSLSRAIAESRASPTRTFAKSTYQNGFRKRSKATSNRCEKRQMKTISDMYNGDEVRSKSKKKLTLTEYSRSLNYYRKNDAYDEWLMPVLSVINRLFSSTGDENGCGCGLPCKWAV
jgi:hypothetical protein